MSGSLRLRTVHTRDYHTAGEPFRIVTGGVPDLEGATVLDRRTWAAEHLDDVRRLLVNEPRGHADMYGCFITPPDDPGAQFGAVFFHKDGYSTACGHGTIALGRWAADTDRLSRDPDGVAALVIDVPSGRVEARLHAVDGQVRSVAFRNVPSFVAARAVPVDTSAGRASADLSYGGAFYASVRAADVGLAVTPEHLPGLIALGREVKWALDGHDAVRHPDDERLSGTYGTIFYDELPPYDGAIHQRNVAIFADGEVDRSPCGSGTSARLALLADAGVVGSGDVLVHDSVIGTRFLGRVVETATASGRPAWVTEISGSAHLTGRHEFVLEDGDDLGPGFQLR